MRGVGRVVVRRALAVAHVVPVVAGSDRAVVPLFDDAARAQAGEDRLSRKLVVTK